MLRILKTLLIWFMIAAMPVQGLAAVVKASCGPAHHDGLSASKAGHVHDAAHGAADAHHHHDGEQQAGFDAEPAEASPEASHATAHGSSYCSACAACCVGAFAPPPVVVLPTVHDHSASVLIPPRHIAPGYVPGGLERPPRSILL